jgi:hypothetical protein
MENGSNGGAGNVSTAYGGGAGGLGAVSDGLGGGTPATAGGNGTLYGSGVGPGGGGGGGMHEGGVLSNGNIGGNYGGGAGGGGYPTPSLIPGRNGVIVINWTALPAPTVTSCSPNNGLIAGNTAVTLTGTNFASITGVTFGGAAATSVVTVSATTITCRTPAHVAGVVNVVVANSSGSSKRLLQMLLPTLIPRRR